MVECLDPFLNSRLYLQVHFEAENWLLFCVVAPGDGRY